MTFRFDTWVEADTPREAWEKLRLALEDKRMGDKLKNEFTVTILEDPDEDKARMNALAWCKSYIEKDVAERYNRDVICYSKRPEEMPEFEADSYMRGIYEGLKEALKIIKVADECSDWIKPELTVREVKDFCLSMENVDCDECPLRCKDDYCTIYSDMPLNWDIKEITKLVRGYKPEGEER